MQIKDRSVNLNGLKIEMRPVLKHAEKLWEDNGVELVVTSARDGLHSAGSLHYYGYAVDFRVWGLEHMLNELCEKLQAYLGGDYDVINEGNHVHVEYDRIIKDV